MYSNANILIVEDEKIPAQFLKEILEVQGFNVLDICDRGSDAVEKAIRLKPDVIFMDIMLKDSMSGCDAALKISSLIQTKIIFLTAHSDDEMIEYALDSGAVNYLIKPYREKQILTAVQIALNNKQPLDNKHTVVKLINGYVYHIDKQALYCMNIKIEVGAKSIRLIDYLCLHRGSVVSKEQLSQYIYGKKKETSTMRTLISRLNGTLGFDLIKNNNGFGYKIELA